MTRFVKSTHSESSTGQRDLSDWAHWNVKGRRQVNSAAGRVSPFHRTVKPSLGTSESLLKAIGNLNKRNRKWLGPHEAADFGGPNRPSFTGIRSPTHSNCQLEKERMRTSRISRSSDV